MKSKLKPKSINAMFSALVFWLVVHTIVLTKISTEGVCFVVLVVTLVVKLPKRCGQKRDGPESQQNDVLEHFSCESNVKLMVLSATVRALYKGAYNEKQLERFSKELNFCLHGTEQCQQ
jgi:hypothetical protein